MIHQEVRNFAIKDLYNVDTKFLKKEIELKDYEEAKVLFFLEKLFKDVEHVTNKSIKKHKKLGENTVKFFDNSSSMILNLTHGIKDQSQFDRINLMINSKRFCECWFVMLKEVLNCDNFELKEKLVSRAISAIFRCYTKEGFFGRIKDKDNQEIENRVKEIDIFLAKLSSFFRLKALDNEEELEIIHQTSKLLVRFQQKEERKFIEKIFKLLNINKEFFKVINSIIKSGSDVNLAR